MTDEREKLEAQLEGLEGCTASPCYNHHSAVMAAADDLVAAERLDEHVKTCRAHSPMKAPYERDGHRECGDKWYCEDAPIKEVEHDS